MIRYVIEVAVDSVRRALFQSVVQLGRLVVEDVVETEFGPEPLALLLASGAGHHAATLSVISDFKRFFYYTISAG